MTLKFRNITVVAAAILLSISTATAGLTFKSGVGYKIVCRQWNSGCVLVGASHGQSTPIYYEESSNDSDDAYWYFDMIEEGVYNIRNASTGGYITYDGVRDDYRRYLSLTATPDGANSQWKIESCESGFILTCVGNTSHRINVREGTGHIVGTFAHTGTPSSNEVCNFIDADGNMVVYRDVVYASGTYGVDDAGRYWENNGISSPIVFTTDMTDPVLYTIKNVRSNKYVTLDTTGNLSQDESVAESFYFVKSGDGFVIYNSDGTRYVSGETGAGSSYTDQVTTLVGTPATGDETWNVNYYSTTNAGYTLSVLASEGNNGNYIYWNDYYQLAVGLYRIDGGCTFVFASSDSRHIKMLENEGYDFTEFNESVKTVLQYADTLKVNGKSLIYDKRYKTYILPVDEAYRDGKDFTASVEFRLNDDSLTLALDGNAITTGSVYNFGDITAGRSYEITVDDGDNVLASSPVTFTFMPIVEINGTTFATDVYNEGSMRVNDCNNEGDDVLNIAAFRYRGATASSKQKKAYAVKLRDEYGESLDCSFFGLRSDNNWILDAMAIDRARMRNRVSTDLWLDFSAKPYQTAFKPKAINGTRGRFVEVLRNGYYAGIYCMTEKIDRKQLQLRKIILQSDQIPTDTVGGVLYKSVEWSYSVLMGHNSDVKYYPGTNVSDYSNSSEMWDAWEIKYPDLGDGETIDWAPLYNALNLVAAGSEADFTEKVEDYFDMPVWRDYYLFIELMLATDNHGKNEYLYNYDRRKYNKIGLAPWDLDGTWGMRWDGSETITADATQDFITYLWEHEHGENNFYRRLALYDYKNYNDSLSARYAELRKTYFNPDSLAARFTKYYSLFKDSGADSREYDRWNGSDGISIDWDSEMSYLNNWIHTRVKTLDKQYGYDAASGISNVITDNFSASGAQGQIIIKSDNGIQVRIYTIDGVLLRSRYAEPGITVIDNIPTGIYIVNNRKVSVR